ncbi:hypothetical protein [Azospirillum sp.]|uniref:hypothetical protein n=1 Tax=Azospirillum sp. TaxID=34012 RepID=UPI003D70D8E0
MSKLTYSLFAAKAEPKTTVMTLLHSGTKAECGRMMDRLNKTPGDGRTKCLIYASTGHFVSGTL